MRLYSLGVLHATCNTPPFYLQKQHIIDSQIGHRKSGEAEEDGSKEQVLVELVHIHPFRCTAAGQGPHRRKGTQHHSVGPYDAGLEAASFAARGIKVGITTPVPLATAPIRPPRRIMMG